MKYDIFISYRRQGGSERAELLKAILEKRGYDPNRVFMDTHTLRGGDFKMRIKEAIEQSVNIIVLITKGCFDNIKEEDYWIYELSEASALNKHIIPVFFDGINNIDKYNLPKTLQELPYQNAVSYNHEYSDASYSKLISFLKPDDENVKHNKIRKYTKIILVVVLSLLLGCLIFKQLYNYYNERDKKDNIQIDEGSVDLGLPSGTLWCNCNLGGENSADYGDLYAWGETNNNNDIVNHKAKGLTINNIIGTSYDVATIKKGEQWSLPSEEQFNELISLCKWEWCNQDGHLGYLIKGPNNNTIFLPVAGCMTTKGIEYREQFGYYWIGDRKPKSPNDAKELIIGHGEINIESGKQYIRRSIRPVISKTKKTL